MNKKCLPAIAVPVSLLPVVSVFAEEVGSGTGATVVSELTSVASEMTSTGTSLIPVALGVVTLSMVVIFGIRFFKRIIGK